MVSTCMLAYTTQYIWPLPLKHEYVQPGEDLHFPHPLGYCFTRLARLHPGTAFFIAPLPAFIAFMGFSFVISFMGVTIVFIAFIDFIPFIGFVAFIDFIADIAFIAAGLFSASRVSKAPITPFSKLSSSDFFIIFFIFIIFIVSILFIIFISWVDKWPFAFAADIVARIVQLALTMGSELALTMGSERRCEQLI